MRWCVRATLMSIVVCALSCVSMAFDEFRALYKRRATVAHQQRLGEFLQETTDDYLVHLENGQTMTRDQLAKRMEAYFRDQLVNQLSFAYIVRQVHVSGNEALVEVEQRDKRIQRRRDGKNHLVEANVIHFDTWVKTPTGWKLKKTREGKQLKFAVDGKSQ